MKISTTFIQQVSSTTTEQLSILNTTVNIILQGPKGDKGDTGLGYVYNQQIEASTWTIAHNLGTYPQVTVVTAGGIVVEANVQYISENVLYIYFTIPTKGQAHLN